MKSRSSILTAIVLLGAAVFVAISSTAPGPAVVSMASSVHPASAPARCAASEFSDNPLVAQGQLWETVATSARARAVTMMPVLATAFQEAQTLPVGSRCRIVLSEKFPMLDAEVITRSVADDGTSIVNFRIQGDPSGTLTLQENLSCGFFLGQLYYDGLPVAYEFRSNKDGLVVTRHALDDLLCAVVNTKEHAIEIAGYPPVAKDKEQQGKDHQDDKAPALPAGSQLQEGKSTTVTTVAASSAGPALNVNDVAVVEGNSGTSKLIFTVTLSKADTRKIITVKYATANGSATAGSDYRAASGTLSFPKGSITQTVAVTILGDTAVEPDETFTLKLSSPVNATLARAAAVGTILTDDFAAIPTFPTLSVNDISITEGNSGTSSLLFTVQLSQADSQKIITVNYATADGSATAGLDYTAASGTLSFPKGSTTQTVAVAIMGDTAVEPDATFTLNLSSPVNATITDGSAVGTILNDDLAVIPTLPTLSVNDISVAEGNSGTSSLLFTVQLSQADSQNIIAVNYATADGSATGGMDYTAASGTLSFPKGSTAQTVAVAIMGDTAIEPDATFTLNLSSPVNATITDGSAVGTILNDDLAPDPPSNVPVHNSLPGAVAVAYLDMNGQNVSGLQWTGGGTIVARGIDDTFTQEQMSEIWRRVSEDYAPFQINVTTQESVYLAAPPDHRIRCIITPDNEWYGAVGGVAYIGSFTWTGDTPCWVFSDQLGNNPRYIAEGCSHEIGHTLGLSHDGRISPAQGYYQGQGTGAVGWAPIMGMGCYKSLVQWSKGEYLSANNTEDDLAIITTQNGFGYRIDDHANCAAGATPLAVSGSTVSGSGTIETRDDVDVFSFATQGGVVTFDVSGDATSQNLDILAEIKDAGGNTLASDNPDLLTHASVSASLPAGTYFLHVSGVGRGDYLADGYTDYGSLGQYTLSGIVP